MIMTTPVRRVLSVVLLVAALFASNFIPLSLAADQKANPALLRQQNSPLPWWLKSTVDTSTAATPVAIPISIVGPITTVNNDPWWSKWIDPFITLIGIAISTGFILWRVGAEYGKNLKLQQERARDELYLKINNDIADKVSTASDALTSAGIWVISLSDRIAINLHALAQVHAGGHTSAPLQQRAPDFSRLHSAAAEATAEVLIVLERYEIALPNFRIFQLAISETARRAQKHFYPIFSDLIQYLPVDIPDRPPHVPALPTRVQFDQLKPPTSPHF